MIMISVRTKPIWKRIRNVTRKKTVTPHGYTGRDHANRKTDILQQSLERGQIRKRVRRRVARRVVWTEKGLQRKRRSQFTHPGLRPHPRTPSPRRWTWPGPWQSCSWGPLGSLKTRPWTRGNSSSINFIGCDHQRNSLLKRRSAVENIQ